MQDITMFLPRADIRVQQMGWFFLGVVFGDETRHAVKSCNALLVRAASHDLRHLPNNAVKTKRHGACICNRLNLDQI